MYTYGYEHRICVQLFKRIWSEDYLLLLKNNYIRLSASIYPLNFSYV